MPQLTRFFCLSILVVMLNFLLSVCKINFSHSFGFCKPSTPNCQTEMSQPNCMLSTALMSIILVTLNLWTAKTYFCWYKIYYFYFFGGWVGWGQFNYKLLIIGKMWISYPIPCSCFIFFYYLKIHNIQILLCLEL